MPGVVVVGLQYGDEGKGKIVDHLAERADMVVRYSGGNNAGHTVVHDGKVYKLHLIPSGILHKDVVCVLGNGVVIDLPVMVAELDKLEKEGINTSNIFISDRAHIILPIHKELDGLSESRRGDNKIGTTGRGIGPVYKDKIGRIGVRIGDLTDPALNALVLFQLEEHGFDKSISQGRHRRVTAELRELQKRIAPYITDTSVMINKALGDGKNVLFEGAQGLLIDVDHGTYPYVTSSNSCAGNACVGSGIGPTKIDAVIGVTKAYTTRVGAGPFPTKVTGKVEELLRKNGNEYGTTTGRPRDCGWVDLVALQHAIRANGVTHLAITKLDVLSELEDIQICTRYKSQENFPPTAKKLEQVEPILFTPIKGWKKDISGCRKFDELPLTAQSYTKTIWEGCGMPLVSHIGVGQDREEVIELDDVWK